MADGYLTVPADIPPLAHRAQQIAAFGARVYDMMTSHWSCLGCGTPVQGPAAILLRLVRYVTPDDLCAFLDTSGADAVDHADQPTCPTCGAMAILDRMDYHAHCTGWGADLVARFRPGQPTELHSWSPSQGYGPQPEANDANARTFARDSLYRGICAARERGDTDDADDLLRTAVDHLPGDPYWLEFLPWLSSRGKFSVAGAIASAHVASRPDDAEGHFWLGQIILELITRGAFGKDRSTEAALHMDNALACNPTHAFARLGLANIDRLYGKLDKAMERVEGILATHPYHPEALYTLAVLELEKHPARSLELFERGAKLRPKDPDFPRGMGRALIALGRHAEAADMALKAKELAPDDTRVDELHLAALALK